MAKGKKHIYCQKCGNISNWYRKGKRYKVLVCPKCGIIAHNPIPWSTIGSVVGSVIPGGSLVGGLVGSAIEGITEQKDKPAKQTVPREKAQKIQDLNKLSRNDLIINQVLGE